MKRIYYSILLLIGLLAFNRGHAQSLDSAAAKVENLPNHFFASIQKKYSSLEKNLTRKTNHYLKKMQRQEKKLQRKAGNSDSTLNKPNTNVDSIYRAFRQQLAAKENLAGRVAQKVHLNQYNPFIDTLSTSLSFLEKYKGMADNIKLPTGTLNQLESKLNESEEIQEFMAQRKQQMQNLLATFTKVPASLQNQFLQIKKTAFYYSAQIHQYREMMKDPKQIEQKGLSVLQTLPVFQKFMQKNSQLASLFNLPGSSGSGNPAQVLAGLQTRVSVQGLIQQRITSGGPNAASVVSQNLQNAQSQLSDLKDKLLKSTGLGSAGGNTSDMPDFKPNTQKTKPLLKRLEYGFNMQFSKNNTFVPSGATLALTVGYKLNDAFTTGIGMSYMLGLGSIQHISLTSQGVGFRSYLDWKIPSHHGGASGGLYVSGGYEMNYNSAFKNIAQLKVYDAWQRSALLGLSRKYQISKKLKGTMQLLYDFLARDHVPVSQLVIFRVGYNF